MQVKELVALLAQCDPEAKVTAVLDAPSKGLFSADPAKLQAYKRQEPDLFGGLKEINAVDIELDNPAELGDEH